MRLLSWQAHNLALELSAENDRAGAEWDALAPDQSAAGVPPPSYLLAGYVGAARTPGGDLARALMAGQDLYQPELLRIPALVPLLFASDLAREASPSHAQTELVLLSADDANPGGAPRAAGVCSSIQQFVDGTINAIFNALETEAAQVVGPGGGVLGAIWGWIKAGLERLKAIAKWVVQQLTSPVVRIIRSIAGVLAIAGQVVSALQPWTVRMDANPKTTRFGVGGETISGAVAANVAVGVIDAWPPDILDCAQQAGVTLPPLKPTGDPIVWTLTQTPMPLVKPGAEPSTLDDNAQATLTYVTNQESKEIARGDALEGVLTIAARVRRPELETLKDQFIQLLFAQLPDLIAKILQPILGPKINGLLSQLTGLLASEGVTTVQVTYHTPPAKTPTPAPGQAVGVVVKATADGAAVFEITAHACKGARTTWSGTIVLHGADGDQTFPMTWAFPKGGVKTRTSVGPFSVTASGVTVTGTFHFTITLVLDAAKAPSALVFDLSEDIIAPSGTATYPMNSIFNLGTPIPLTDAVGTVCG